MKKTKNKKICRFCKKEKKDLMKSCRVGKNQYYSCRECNNIKQKKWYHKSLKHKLQQQEYNRNYLLKQKNK